MAPRFARLSNMDSARTPKALAPKASTSVVSWFVVNAFAVCRGMELSNVGRRFRHDGAQRERRALLLGRMRQDPWTELTVSCHGWRIFMRGLIHLCPEPLSFAVGRPFQWIGCWIGVMTYPTASGSDRCMSSCSPCASSQQLWIAPPRAARGKFRGILVMDAHHLGRCDLSSTRWVYLS